jgi:hypothetical protein
VRQFVPYDDANTVIACSIGAAAFLFLPLLKEKAQLYQGPPMLIASNGDFLQLRDAGHEHIESAPCTLDI